MNTTVSIDGALAERMEARIESLTASGSRLSRTELALSLIATALDRLDGMDALNPGEGDRFFVNNFVSFRKRVGRKPGSARHVFRDDGEEFDSVKDAAEAMGVTVPALRHVLDGRQKTCCGHKWEWAPDPLRRDSVAGDGLLVED